jgi:DNA-binding LytR/AlgR family response regulator
MKLNCLIVDDEPIARKGMAEYVKEVDFLNLVCVCEHAVKASSILNSQKIDLLLLDIHMPRLSGIEFLKTLTNPPMVILVTAYPEYALEGYELDVVDYLVKPVSWERFIKAVQKAHDFFLLKHKAESTSPTPTDYFFIKCDHKFEKVNYRDVLYIEAMQNYCIIHTIERKMITYITLSSLENQLPADRFLKVHKSYLVSIEKINSLNGQEIIIGRSRIPVSRNLKEEVFAKIMGNNLYKRN